MLSGNIEAVDLQVLTSFIYQSSQECKEEEIQKGVENVLIALNKNPLTVMRIIKDHPTIPAIFLFDDLVEKMKRGGNVEKLGVLLDRYLDEFVDVCIYNQYDLAKCKKTIPDHIDKIIEHIVSNEKYFKRILAADKDPGETSKDLLRQYPKRQGIFSTAIEKYRKSAAQSSSESSLSSSALMTEPTSFSFASTIPTGTIFPPYRPDSLPTPSVPEQQAVLPSALSSREDESSNLLNQKSPFLG